MLKYFIFISSLIVLIGCSSHKQVQKTGLKAEIVKKISELSKGYKQRVGLAQALLHDPEVLILDEPTSGLDPSQLKEMRALIRELGKEKTVIFSSHIMQEIEAACSFFLDER